MTAQDALDNIIAEMPTDLELQGEIAALSRAAETQDKLDWLRQQAREMRALGLDDEEPDTGIWAEN